MTPLVVGAVALALLVPPHAQEPSLEFEGLRPGLAQDDLRAAVARLGGVLSCKPSTAEPRLVECRGGLTAGPEGARWELIASLVDGTTGVLVLSSGSTEASLSRLHQRLSAALGRPNLKRQGTQQSYEWIRGGRMMRLTSRPEGGRLKMSVSLIDGDVLDRLSRGEPPAN
jgi:hypothetical protein